MNPGRMVRAEELKVHLANTQNLASRAQKTYRLIDTFSLFVCVFMREDTAAPAAVRSRSLSYETNV